MFGCCSHTRQNELQPVPNHWLVWGWGLKWWNDETWGFDLTMSRATVLKIICTHTHTSFVPGLVFAVVGCKTDGFTGEVAASIFFRLWMPFLQSPCTGLFVQKWLKKLTKLLEEVLTFGVFLTLSGNVCKVNPLCVDGNVSDGFGDGCKIIYNVWEALTRNDTNIHEGV